MRKIVAHYHVGYVGMDGIEFFEVDESMTDDQINDIVHQGAVEHASLYGYYPHDEYQDIEEADFDDWESDQYSDNIEGYFEDYDPEKHDSQTPGGGTPQFSRI